MGMILTLFYLQVTLMLPTKFGVSWKVKNRFLRWQPWRPSWISNQNDFSYFDLLVTVMFPNKFQDNQPFVSGEAKNRISRWRPSWISDQTILAISLFTSHPDASYQVSCQVAFQFRS